MTQLLDHAITTLRALPADTQDDLARVLLTLLGEEQPVLQLSPEEDASFDQSLAEADRGEFVADNAVEALFAKYGA